MRRAVFVVLIVVATAPASRAGSLSDDLANAMIERDPRHPLETGQGAVYDRSYGHQEPPPVLEDEENLLRLPSFGIYDRTLRSPLYPTGANASSTREYISPLSRPLEDLEDLGEPEEPERRPRQPTTAPLKSTP